MEEALFMDGGTAALAARLGEPGAVPVPEAHRAEVVAALVALQAHARRVRAALADPASAKIGARQA